MENENAGVEEVGGAADEQELNEDLGAPQGQEDDTDWKALYEKAAEDRDNYKTALTQKRGLRKTHSIPESESEEDEEDDDAPVTKKDLQRVLQEAVLPVVAENKVETKLESLVKDPEKRKLVKLYYDTRIRQTGTSDEAIQRDLNTALDLADAQKLRKTSAELIRKNMQQTVPPTAGSAGDPPAPSKTHKFSADQVKALTDRARLINADPDKFIAAAWKNQAGR